MIYVLTCNIFSSAVRLVVGEMWNISRLRVTNFTNKQAKVFVSYSESTWKNIYGPSTQLITYNSPSDILTIV